MVRSLQYFKDKFVTGYLITEDDMQDWLDSFRHVSQAVPLSDTTGLSAILADYRAKSEDVPLDEVSGLLDYINELLSNYITTGSQIEQSQVNGLVDALAAKATLTQVQNYVDGLGLTSGEDGDDGVSVTDVTINEDKHLIITLSNGDPIDAGLLPSAEPPKYRTAYNWQIVGARDNSNMTFKIEGGKKFKAGTLKVYRQGGRLTPNGNDYTELDDRTGVLFNKPVLPDENLIYDYEEE